MILLEFSPRVSNFIDAADVGGNIKYSSDNLSYLNQIDSACKEAGITTGAVYPFIGGTAFSHKFNLLNPLQFQLTYFGTINHNINGVNGDGISGTYIDTGFIISSNLTLGNKHFSIYTPTTIIEPNFGFDIGAEYSITKYTAGITNGYNGTTRYTYNNVIPSSGLNTTTLLHQKGMLMGNSLNGINNLIKNGNIIGTNNVSVTEEATSSVRIIQIFQANNMASQIKTYSFASVGNGLSDTQLKIFSHNIYNAQRSINRA